MLILSKEKKIDNQIIFILYLYQFLAKYKGIDAQFLLVKSLTHLFLISQVETRHALSLLCCQIDLKQMIM